MGTYPVFKKHKKGVRIMRARDKMILESLRKFRCLSRDDIREMHFSELKNSIQACNTVMKRLTRDQYVEVNTESRPYIYFPSPSPLKKDSQKIKHYQAIANFFLELNKWDKPLVFDVEVKFEKGMCEPDIFMIWRNQPFFVEIQRSIYSPKMMNEKMDRYHLYYSKGQWKYEWWQNKEPIFPIVWIVTEMQYALSYPFQIIQSKTVMEKKGQIEVNFSLL